MRLGSGRASGEEPFSKPWKRQWSCGSVVRIMNGEILDKMPKWLRILRDAVREYEHAEERTESQNR